MVVVFVVVLVVEQLWAAQFGTSLIVDDVDVLDVDVLDVDVFEVEQTVVE
jgi:hypothetical protein